MQRFGDIIISPSPSDFFYTIYHRALTLANITGTDFILIGGQNDIFEYGLIDRPKQLQESGYQLICPELGDCGNSGTLIHSSIYSELLGNLDKGLQNDGIKQMMKLLQLNGNIRSHVGEKLIEHFRKPKHIAATFFGGIKGTTLLPSQYRKNKTVELYDYPWVVEKDNEVVSIVVSETQKSIFREVSRCSKKMHQIELADGFEGVQIALGAMKAFLNSDARYVTLSYGQIADCFDFQDENKSAVMKTQETFSYARPNYFHKNFIDISAWPPEHSVPEQSKLPTYLNRRAVKLLVQVAEHVDVGALTSIQFVITGLLREIAQIKFTIE